MLHHEIINAICTDEFKDYLEIGVERGETFNKICIKNKVAVDPNFKVPIEELNGRTFSQTSDSFFFRNYEQFDCIFIDGLHHFEQVRKDFINSVGRLKPNGIIFIDDCIPTDELAAMRSHHDCVQAKIARGDVDRNWMGDVYKFVVWLNDFTDFSYAHVTGSVGVFAVWRESQTRSPMIGDENQISELKLNEFQKLYFPSRTIQEIASRYERKNSYSLSKVLRSLNFDTRIKT